MMGPGTAVLAALRRSFDFSGRSTRAEFWWSWIVLYIIATIVMMYGGLAMTGPRVDALLTIVAFGVALPMIAVGTRRLADAGLWRWLFVLTFILGIATQVLYFIQMPSMSDLYAMSFQAERNNVDLPLSGYELHHVLRALRDVVLPRASQALAILCLLFALLPSRRTSDRAAPLPPEVTP